MVEARNIRPTAVSVLRNQAAQKRELAERLRGIAEELDLSADRMEAIAGVDLET